MQHLLRHHQCPTEAASLAGNGLVAATLCPRPLIPCPRSANPGRNRTSYLDHPDTQMESFASPWKRHLQSTLGIGTKWRPHDSCTSTLSACAELVLLRILASSKTRYCFNARNAHERCPATDDWGAPGAPPLHGIHQTGLAGPCF